MQPASKSLVQLAPRLSESVVTVQEISVNVRNINKDVDDLNDMLREMEAFPLSIMLR